MPPAELAGAIDAGTGVVAFSAVQMSTGEVADLDAILAAAEAHDVLTLVDATQAAGWLPLEADRFDFLVAAGYKWLISPRGTAWMTVAPERLDAVLPQAAGWFAGDDAVRGLHRAAAAAGRRRAAARHLPRLVLLRRLPAGARAARRRRHRGDPRAQRRAWRTTSAPASACRRATRRSCRFPLPGDIDALRAAGVQAAMPGGRLRVGFHLYNDEEDADRAVDVLQVSFEPSEG